MNYWERHIGDYARDAGHLSMLEHGAYTLLLDRYYSTEKPVPADQAHRICRARSKEERAAVDAVLAEFFSLVEGEWVNGRATREVAKAQTKIEAARTNGAKGGRPKKNQTGTEQKPSGLLLGSISETQPKAHQTPDTNSLSPSGKKEGRKRAAAPQLVSVEDMVAEGVDRQHAADWLVSRNKKDLPLTPTAWQLTKDEAAKAGLTVAKAIETAAGASWAGFKASWLISEKQTAARAPSRHSGFDTKDYRAGVNSDGSLV